MGSPPIFPGLRFQNVTHQERGSNQAREVQAGGTIDGQKDTDEIRVMYAECAMDPSKVREAIANTGLSVVQVSPDSGRGKWLVFGRDLTHLRPGERFNAISAYDGSPSHGFVDWTVHGEEPSGHLVVAGMALAVATGGVGAIFAGALLGSMADIGLRAVKTPGADTVERGYEAMKRLEGASPYGSQCTAGLVPPKPSSGVSTRKSGTDKGGGSDNGPVGPSGEGP